MASPSPTTSVSSSARTSRGPRSGDGTDVDSYVPTFELSDWEIDTQTAADIAALMSIGRRDQVEFLIG